MCCVLKVLRRVDYDRDCNDESSPRSQRYLLSYIDYMYEYGVEVTSYDQWDKLLERAAKIAMEDYMEGVELERAEQAIAYRELHND